MYYSNQFPKKKNLKLKLYATVHCTGTVHIRVFRKMCVALGWWVGFDLPQYKLYTCVLYILEFEKIKISPTICYTVTICTYDFKYETSDFACLSGSSFT